jgi:Ca2+-transporting ATPase
MPGAKTSTSTTGPSRTGSRRALSRAGAGWATGRFEFQADPGAVRPRILARRLPPASRGRNPPAEDSPLPRHAFDIHATPGLTESEAAARLAADGPNEIPSAKPRNLLQLALAVMREPMLLLLVAAGAINLVVSTQEPERVQDAALLFVFVGVVIGITLRQARKTERALAALRDLASPRALVVRDGAQRRIPGREVVTGDVLLVAEGDRVAADAVVLDAANLTLDESLLTGESVPVRKTRAPGDATLGRPGGDGTPHLFSGTLVTKGQGVARVAATGLRSELGRIGSALGGVTPAKTRLEAEVARIVSRLAIVGIGLAVVIVVFTGITRADWLAAFLAGITFAMAMLPEEFPVVLTVFLALGAWRISKSNVLTRRMPAVETIGATTVLCADKTGTLTQNRMTVSALQSRAGLFRIEPSTTALPEHVHEIAEYALLASPIDPFDPMDVAFRALADRFLAQTEHVHRDWTLEREYPLSDRLLAMSHVWRSPEGSDYAIAAKGAPEAVADLCHLDAARLAEVLADVTRLAEQGMRVLGVARATFRAAEGLPGIQHDFAFAWVGLVGLRDPIRESVPAALAECRAAGIRVVMITGDYPATALAIAREIGLAELGRVIAGSELDALDDEALGARVRDAAVFARVVPAQKLRIVRALQRSGEVVAMTGDGVNDAPALKAADIGIAMGQRGTDVAREAAALVLTDDDFSSIVAAVRVGRRIHDNLRKAMAYIVAVHIPIAGMSLVPVLLPGQGGALLPLVLMPVHIAFLELIIDPACSVVFEAEADERGIMRRPPRRVDAPIFSRRMLAVGVAQGAVVLLAVLAIYGWGVAGDAPAEEIRATTFTALVMANLGLIFVNRSWTQPVLRGLREPNASLWIVSGGTLATLAVLLSVPFAQRLFDLSAPSAASLASAAAAGVLSVLWFDGYKWMRARGHASVA